MYLAIVSSQPVAVPPGGKKLMQLQEDINTNNIRCGLIFKNGKLVCMNKIQDASKVIKQVVSTRKLLQPATIANDMLYDVSSKLCD